MPHGLLQAAARHIIFCKSKHDEKILPATGARGVRTVFSEPTRATNNQRAGPAPPVGAPGSVKTSQSSTSSYGGVTRGSEVARGIPGIQGNQPYQAKLTMKKR